METILNLVWLGVTVAVLWLWHFRWKGARRKPGHDVRLEAVAMICILALLFPVISLTDDLHPEVIPVEASASKRSLSLLAAQHARGNAHMATHQQFASVYLRESLRPVNFQSSGPVPLLLVSQSLSRCSALAGRAPPYLA